MKLQLYCILFSIAFFSCQSTKEKIRLLLEKECDCAQVDVVTYQTKQKKEVLSYNIKSPKNTDFKAEVHRLLYIVQQEEPNFCITDKKIIFQFITKDSTKVFSLENCVPKQVQ